MIMYIIYFVYIVEKYYCNILIIFLTSTLKKLVSVENIPKNWVSYLTKSSQVSHVYHPMCRIQSVITKLNCTYNFSQIISIHSGLDQRLRKRTASALPGPKLDELQAKRPCPPEEGTVHHSPQLPLLPAPALGTAGPVVRAAGLFRLQVWCFFYGNGKENSVELRLTLKCCVVFFVYS